MEFPIEDLFDDGRTIEMNTTAPLPTRILNLIHALLHGPDAGDVRGVCEVAVRVAQRLNMSSGVQNAVQHYLERWDGKGPYGLLGSPYQSRGSGTNGLPVSPTAKLRACRIGAG